LIEAQCDIVRYQDNLDNILVSVGILGVSVVKLGVVVASKVSAFVVFEVP